MSKREYFPAFFSYKRTLKGLSDEQMGRVFRAALEYADTGEEPELDPMEMMGFAFMREDIDRANANYQEFCEKQKANGSRGGRKQTEKPNGFSENPKNPTVVSETQKSQSESKGEGERKAKEDNTTSYEVVSAPDGANAQKQKRFVPPKIEDVRAYAAENGLADDAERFVDYFESCGWVIGNSKKSMKDWKSAYRNWARNRDSYNPRAAPKQQSSDPLMEYLDRVIAGEE